MKYHIKKPELVNTIFCPKCLQVKPRTAHHLLPQRFYEPDHSPLLYICAECHRALERFIPHEMQPEVFYYDIVKLFLSAR